MIAEARITWPTVRRIKFISRITVATILTDAIESAVPRKSDVIRRLLGSGSIESGRASPSATPQVKGMMMPAIEAMADAPPVRRTSFRSVSMPVRSKSIRTPNCEMASSMAFCSFAAGKIACCQSGASAPSTEGPSTRPAINCPITPGCLIRIMASPSSRPTIISNTSCAKNTNSDGLCSLSAAKAGVTSSVGLKKSAAAAPRRRANDGRT